MKIEKMCCTIEQAKKLQALGVDQKSLFYWRFRNQPGEFWNIEQPGTAPSSWQFAQDEYSAFTVAELGEMLPTGYDTMKITVNKNNCEWQGYDLDSKPFPEEQTYTTESQCRAAMLIHLIEFNLLSVNEVNERIK